MRDTAIAISLWMLMIISATLDASAEWDTTTSTTAITGQSDFNKILATETAGLQEVGIGKFKVSVPLMNIGAVKAIFGFLTWDFNWIPDWLNLVRLFLAGITFWFSFMFFVEYGPVLISLAEFLGRTVGSITGGALNVARSLARF